MAIDRHHRAKLAALALALAACGPDAPPGPAPAAETLTLTRAQFADLADWALDDHAEARAAFVRSCARLEGRPAEAPWGPVSLGLRAGDLQDACTDRGTDAREFFERHFVPFAASGPNGAEGLMTGYYEPVLNVAETADARFTAPIHRRPPELVTVDLGLFREEWRDRTLSGRVVDGRVVPYLTREAIVAGGLAGRGLEIAWADSDVDVFFMHIQGSGALRFPDGRIQRVGFDGQNGYLYTAIGAEMVRENLLPREQATMQGIRGWLAEHRDQAAAMMNRNRSYIFFRPVADGPVGASGVVLSAGRSLAVDAGLHAYGLPIWLDTRDPVDDSPLRRLMIAQDRGGAIRGAVRGDYFFGSGEDAGERAGRMRGRGRFWVLLPTAAAARR